MPVAHADLVERSISSETPIELPFPPVTKSHILNCSYHAWYPKYRSLIPKARLIPLSQPFLSYLRADGIRLPPEDNAPPDSWDTDSSSTDSDEDAPEPIDPSHDWQPIHQQIKTTIASLHGSVMPKLNWSAPKDATWIAATNSMECTTPNDIYLLLKSSDFITHDLEQVFHDCEPDSDSDPESDSASNTDSQHSSSSSPAPPTPLSKIPYHLILRKTIPNLNPALEFRSFVRARHLLCITQRDLNHYSFLAPLVPHLRLLIQDFFSKHLQRTFPDENFVFDVYIPEPYTRVWLIDVNPWAPRTDPLLFSWLEILGMRGGAEADEGVVRLYLRRRSDGDGDGDGALDCEAREINGSRNRATVPDLSTLLNAQLDVHESEPEEEEDDEEDEEEAISTPEFRLVNRDDPEAYSFNTPQYSAHKLPRDVVDAAGDGTAGLREFMGTWREEVARREREEEEEEGGVE